MACAATAPLPERSSADPAGFASHQQAIAASPAHSAWVDASAGSGKTKVLIDRVLRLLLAGVPAQHILCLTFTKAAAANMAVRLTDELGRWACMPQPQLAEKLEKLTGTLPDDTRLESARRLFAATLDAPGGLQFQTIHGFCQSLLARFPLEAGVPVGFAVLDDRQSQTLLSEARRSLLDEASANPGSELALALTTLLEAFAGDSFADLEKEIVQQRATLEPQLESGPGVPLAALGKLLGVTADDGEDKLSARFCADDWHNTAALRELATVMIADGGKTNKAHGEIIAGWLAAPPELRLLLLGEYLEVFIKQDGELRTLDKLCTKNLRKAHPHFDGIITSEQETCLRFLERRRTLRSYLTSSALIIYASALLQRYHALKAQRLALDFDDLITAAARLVNAERASWVLFKLDGGIEHILVDEAQDTNDRQWQIIGALTGDFFSGSGAREHAPQRTVFAVGDFKQSIYSFQGAEPAAFVRARDDFTQRIASLGQDLRRVHFNVSFRSTTAVLAAVDRVFTTPEPVAGLPDYASHMSHLPDLPGRVDVWPVAPPDSKDSAQNRHPAIKTAQLLAAQIKTWVEGREILPARGRPLEYGDFLVLVRTRGTFMPEFVRACKQLGVPVSGADRMVIDEQLAVEDLLAFATFLLLPEDDLTLACVLKGPFIGMDEDTLFRLSYGRGGDVTLLSRLGQNEQTRGIAAWLASWQKRADRITPYALLSALLAEPCPQDAHSGRRAIVARLGPQANDPMDELLTLALNFEQSQTPSLQGFLRWVKSGKTEIKRELEQAAGQVRTMTAHGAKGLQAPVVIVANGIDFPHDKNRLLLDPDGKDPPLLAARREDEATPLAARRNACRQKQREEYHRLLYVALTRAEDWLIVASWGNRRTSFDADGRLKNDPSTPSWYHLVAAGLQNSAETGYDFTALGGWRGPGLRLESGKPGTSRPEQRSIIVKPERPAALPQWSTQSPLPEPAPSRPLTPSRPEDEDIALSPLENGDTARFKRGLLIHRLLQTLPDLPPERRRAAALAWLGRQTAKPEALADEVLRVLGDPTFGVLFGPNSKAEVPVTARLGARVLAGQIDRIAVTADTVWLADYKTNRSIPASATEVDPAYLRQLAAYRAALRPLYPQHAIRAILLWTNAPLLMEIPNNQLDVHTP